MIDPPVWTTAQLDKARQRAEQHFREERHLEPLELYLELFDEHRGAVEEFLEQTVDSIKRLNNDAAVKAETWRTDFGTRQVVPAAVLSGVYKLRNLEDAQARGLTLFWAHDLQQMVDWIHRTRIAGDG